MSLNALEWILWSIACWIFGGYCFNKEMRRKINFIMTGKSKYRKRDDDDEY